MPVRKKLRIKNFYADKAFVKEHEMKQKYSIEVQKRRQVLEMEILWKHYDSDGLLVLDLRYKDWTNSRFGFSVELPVLFFFFKLLLMFPFVLFRIIPWSAVFFSFEIVFIKL